MLKMVHVNGHSSATCNPLHDNVSECANLLAPSTHGEICNFHKPCIKMNTKATAVTVPTFIHVLTSTGGDV